MKKGLLVLCVSVFLISLNSCTTDDMQDENMVEQPVSAGDEGKNFSSLIR